MGLPEDDNALERALRRVPWPVRVAIFVLFWTVAAFVRWEDINEHDVAPLLDVIVALGLLLMAAVGVPRVFRSFRAPDRRPFDLNPLWLAFFTITGSLLVLGPWSFIDDDPSTSPYIGGPMFVVGVVLAAAFIRWFSKPVRPEAQNDPVAEWIRRADEKPPQVGANWYSSRPSDGPDKAKGEPD